MASLGKKKKRRLIERERATAILGPPVSDSTLTLALKQEKKLFGIVHYLNSRDVRPQIPIQFVIPELPVTSHYVSLDW